MKKIIDCMLKHILNLLSLKDFYTDISHLSGNYYKKDNKCWQGCGKLELLYIVVKCKMVQPLRKDNMEVLQKIKNSGTI